MNDVTKLLSSLRQTQNTVDTGGHPDADLLTAFMEASLMPRERARVLDHLALCGDCREIMVLAVPPVEETMPVLKPAAAGWFTWRAWKWAAAASACVIVVGAALLQKPQPTQFPSASVATSDAAQVSAPATASNQPSTAKSTPRSKATVQVAQAKRSEKLAPEPTTGRLYTASNEMGHRLPGTSLQRAVSAGSSVDQAPASTRDMLSVTVRDDGNSEVSRAAIQGASTVMRGPAQNSIKMPVSNLRVGMAWAVAGGRLLRSPNGGSSWQPVLLGSPVVFRSVFAIGMQVWAGGDGGAFFRSHDDGETFDRIQVQGMSGNIVQINFIDENNGLVSTTSGQWITRDGGESWSVN